MFEASLGARSFPRVTPLSQGGGVYVASGGSAIISDSTLDSNTATSNVRVRGLSRRALVSLRN